MLETMNKLYFPVVANQRVELGIQEPGRMAGHVKYLVKGSFVIFPTYWSEIEAEKDILHWNLDENVEAAKDHEIIFSIRNSPEWARDGSKECEPPRPSNYQDFVFFVLDLLDHYSDYDVHGIEIWNEPDVDAEVVGSNAHYYGCFGNSEEGGQRYADLVNVVYDAVKDHNPAVKVAAGALLLGRTPSVFWEAAEAVGIKYDVISFHSYPAYQENNFKMTFDKANYLRTFSDKPLWLTETSVLSHTESDGHDREHADYLKYILAGALDHQIEMVINYALAGNGWMNTDLIGPGGRKKPAWEIYNKHLTGGLYD